MLEIKEIIYQQASLLFCKILSMKINILMHAFKTMFKVFFSTPKFAF